MDAVRQQAGITFRPTQARRGIAMGLFDTFFSSVTGGQSLKTIKRRGSRLRRRPLCSQATRPLKTPYFRAGREESRALAFSFQHQPQQARALTGWVRNMEDGSVEDGDTGAPAKYPVLISRAFRTSNERMGTRFRLVDAQAQPHLPMKTVSAPRY